MMINAAGLVRCRFCKCANLGLQMEPIIDTHYYICHDCLQQSSIADFFFQLKHLPESIIYANIKKHYV